MKPLLVGALVFAFVAGVMQIVKPAHFDPFMLLALAVMFVVLAAIADDRGDR